METWKPLTSVTWLAGVAHPTTLYHSVTFALDQAFNLPEFCQSLEPVYKYFYLCASRWDGVIYLL
jgi:hypothetical protein